MHAHARCPSCGHVPQDGHIGALRPADLPGELTQLRVEPRLAPSCSAAISCGDAARAQESECAGRKPHLASLASRYGDAHARRQDREQHGPARMGAPDHALAPVGRHLLLRGGGSPGADAAHTRVRPRRSRGPRVAPCGVRQRPAYAGKPRALGRVLRHGRAEQPDPFHADLLGADPDHGRPRRHPERDDAAVRGRARARADPR